MWFISLPCVLFPMSSFEFRQDIFRSNHPAIQGISCDATNVAEFLPPFLNSVRDSIVGLAPTYGSRGELKTLALASQSEVLVVRMASKTKKQSKKKGNARPLDLQDFLCKPTFHKYVFEMDKLASALFLDCKIHIVAAKDLLSISTGDRYSLNARLNALGGEATLFKEAVARCFQHEETTSNNLQTVALQAWAASNAASLPYMSVRLEKANFINTVDLDRRILRLVSKAIRNGSRLDSLKPNRVKNDVKKECVIQTGGSIAIVSERYKTRVMSNRNSGQILKITTEVPGGGVKVSYGRATEVTGRGAKVKVDRGDKPATRVRSVETIGKEPQTSAESLRSWIILNTLQGVVKLSNHAFLSKMWFGKKIPLAVDAKLDSVPSFHFPSTRELSISQRKAVDAILSTEDTQRTVVIHGPPGTGKTTVIAAAVTSIMASPNQEKTIWLVAQSNVAVKNIAEKLATVDFWNFKILISKDFHFDWHEHLYEKIERNVIRSDSFDASPVVTSRQLLGSRVLLCTLSMLSNDKLATISRLVPLRTVIFDEASQIEIGDYLPLLVRFHSTLRKLVFIGDDKQLAPYGSSDIPDLESIFEKRHLRDNAFFLDTQYRMPIPIGNFISTHVYKKELKSQHSITDPQCCRFVDISKGLELSQGRSWKNTQEVDMAIIIARQLTKAKKSFRIITPYDPQRNLLEKGLKSAGLPWEDKCFNIDAFQGNEDDYIIISLVRSEKLGFLREARRTNVMLTRCKKAMIICTSRKFIEGPAAESLVGKLSKSLPGSAWMEDKHVRGGVRPFI